MGWSQEGERDDCRDFFFCFPRLCPKRLFFPPFAKHFSEMGNNLNDDKRLVKERLLRIGL